MKSFKTKISLHNEKESTWKIRDKATKLKFQNVSDLAYLGYEVTFGVEIFEDGSNKVLSVNGIDVQDKGIKL